MQRPGKAELEGAADEFRGVLHRGDVLLLAGYLKTNGYPLDGLCTAVAQRFQKLCEACDEYEAKLPDWEDTPKWGALGALLRRLLAYHWNRCARVAAAYQPKTGASCGCRRGVQRDNCPSCEGTGMVIDFAAIRGRRI